MKPLSAFELLRTWEEGMDQPLHEKTLRLLAKACSVADYNDIGDLSIGERDARLLQIREWLFGSRLMNIANCPKCRETIEWATNTEDLHLQPLPSELSVKSFRFDKDNFSINFRLPNTHDIIKATASTENGFTKKEILSDCIVEISMDGKEFNENNLPDHVLDALSKQMEMEDPQADIRMNISCPACTHSWQARFDIVSFLWAEIHNWAQRILQDVALLARSFGWSENDILNMSARRRQFYLQLIGS